MEAFTEFLINNYLWFLVIAIVLILALIGYIVDANHKEENVSDEFSLKSDEEDITKFSDTAKVTRTYTKENDSNEEDIPLIIGDNK